MKQTTCYLLLTMLMSIFGVKTFAYDIAVENVDGITIFYNYINDGKELEVNSFKPGYEDSISLRIPELVTYMDRSRKVTSIGRGAFENCSNLYSVSIPNSINCIGEYAFDGCSGLKKVIIGDIATWCGISFNSNPLNYAQHLYSDENTEITELVIPNSVTCIGDNSFSGCAGIKSITIPSSVNSIGNYSFKGCTGLTSLIIPNSVTSIGSNSFENCTGLISVSLPNNVTIIKAKTFKGCKGLLSVTIPNSVTEIGRDAFDECYDLKKVIIPDLEAWCRINFENPFSNPIYCANHIYYNENTEISDLNIPNGISSINKYAFYRCNSITSVVIPNSVTFIGEGAFWWCESLKSLTIGEKATSISKEAFANCDLTNVISLIKEPHKIETNTFSKNAFYNATLLVPEGTIDKYKATEGWKNFVWIEESNGSPNDPITPTCETPTINYNNGVLTFYCATEGATCVSSISDSDISSYTTNEVQLNITYNISVYALKEGYNNSEMVTATLCWIDANPKTEGISNSVNQIKANAVLVQSNDGKITISGAEDDTIVSVYGINGIQAGTGICKNGQAIINTNLSLGDIGIIKLGEKTIKIIIK